MGFVGEYVLKWYFHDELENVSEVAVFNPKSR